MSSNTYFLFIFFIYIYGCDSNEQLSYEELINKYIKINDDYRSADQRLLIFPGTFWCGVSDISPDNNTLGPLYKADSCCRQHDRCSDIIPAGQTKYGLTNTAFYTKLNCTCDENFYRCLKNNNDKSSDIIGIVYFDVLSTQCFRYDYPIVGCSQYLDVFGRKCKSYVLDNKAPKKYQWFDLPEY